MKEKIRDILLFLLLFEILFANDHYIYVGGFGVGFQYLGCIAMIFLCFLSFLNTPKVGEFLLSVKMTGILAMPYIFNMLISLVIWIFSFTKIRQIISGFFEPAYIILTIMTVGSMFYVWGRKTVNYVFWAVTLVFSYLVVFEISKVGINEFLHQFYVLVSSNATRTMRSMKNLENPRFSYAYTFFILYFLFHRKQEGNIKFIVKMAISILFFLLGLKRICEAALAMGIIMGVSYSRFGENGKRYFMTMITVIFISFSLIYVPFVRYGLFDNIVQALHINTSARDTIYDLYSEHYEVSPTYFGHGLGWVRNYRRNLEGIEAFNVHCEYVKNYIELGFWGYGLWVLAVIPGILYMTVKRKRRRDDATIIGVLGAYAVLMVAENIFYFYMSSLVMGVIIMACASREIQEGDGSGASEKNNI